jgi:hypothetical protein
MAILTDDEKRMYLMFHAWKRREITSMREAWIREDEDRFYYSLEDAYRFVRRGEWLSNGYTD